MTLQRLNWSGHNYRSLLRMVKEAGPSPLAVFDWDNTMIHGDAGEFFFRNQILRGDIRLTSAEWRRIIPGGTGRIERIKIAGGEEKIETIRSEILLLVEKIRKSGRSLSPVNSDWLDAAVRLLWMNRGLEEAGEAGRRFAYRWVTRFLKGFSPEEIFSLAKKGLEEELMAPLSGRSIVDRKGKYTFSWVQGLRFYPEMVDLFRFLKRRGWQVVVVTATHAWIVQAMLDRGGLEADGIIGMDSRISGEALTAEPEVKQVLNYGRGKAENIRRLTGREPLFTAGDSNSDVEMLSGFSATRCRLIIDRGLSGPIQKLVEKARRREDGYLLQKFGDGL